MIAWRHYQRCVQALGLPIQQDGFNAGPGLVGGEVLRLPGIDLGQTSHCGKKQPSVLRLQRRGRVTAGALLLQHSFVLSKHDGLQFGSFSCNERINFLPVQPHEAAIATEPQVAEVVRDDL